MARGFPAQIASLLSVQDTSIFNFGIWDHFWNSLKTDATAHSEGEFAAEEVRLICVCRHHERRDEGISGRHRCWPKTQAQQSNHAKYGRKMGVVIAMRGCMHVCAVCVCVWMCNVLLVCLLCVKLMS